MGQIWIQAPHSLQKSGRTPKTYSTWRFLPRPTNPFIILIFYKLGRQVISRILVTSTVLEPSPTLLVIVSVSVPLPDTQLVILALGLMCSAIRVTVI